MPANFFETLQDELVISILEHLPLKKRFAARTLNSKFNTILSSYLSKQLGVENLDEFNQKISILPKRSYVKDLFTGKGLIAITEGLITLEQAAKIPNQYFFDNLFSDNGLYALRTGLITPEHIVAMKSSKYLYYLFNDPELWQALNEKKLTPEKYMTLPIYVNFSNQSISSYDLFQKLDELKKSNNIDVPLPIRYLNVSKTSITDDICYFSPEEFPYLSYLDMSYTGITDLGFLKDLPRLKVLKATGLDIDNIEPLNNITSLEVLFLNKTKLSGLTPLENLINLKILVLESTNVADLTSLKSLSALEKIYLKNTKINNRNQLFEIYYLPNLKTLSVDKNLRHIARIIVEKRFSKEKRQELADMMLNTQKEMERLFNHIETTFSEITQLIQESRPGSFASMDRLFNQVFDESHSQDQFDGDYGFYRPASFNRE